MEDFEVGVIEIDPEIIGQDLDDIDPFAEFTDVEEEVYDYYTTPEECWEKDGGQYLRDWNKYYDDKWICNWCKFESQKLSDFIPKN